MSKEPKATVKAEEILEKIQKGESIELTEVLIEGNLDLRGLNLPTQHVNRTELHKANGLTEEVKIINSPISITFSTIPGELDFGNLILKKGANFMGTSIGMRADFGGTTFCDTAHFLETLFGMGADFEGASFRESAIFQRATFNGHAFFFDASFDDYVYFDEVSFKEDVSFSGTSFNKHILFDGSIFGGKANFKKTYFGSYANFDGTSFNGDVLTFRDAIFKIPMTQEEACRRAKNVLERNGDREEAGYHFYREMDGKRKQKPGSSLLEYIFIQLIFGYGVHPFRLMFCWLLIATIFAFFYAASDGIVSKLPASSSPENQSYFVECLYFSIVTAATPGYGKYELTSWEYQVIASAEAILGTFMWAAFIATFARKYMR